MGGKTWSSETYRKASFTYELHVLQNYASIKKKKNFSYINNIIIQTDRKSHQRTARIFIKEII